MNDVTREPDELDPDSLIKRVPVTLGHRILHVRIAEEDLKVFDQLCRLTPTLTDTQRVLDAARLATYLLLMQRSSKALPSDTIGYLGLFKMFKLPGARPGPKGGTR